MHLNGVEVAMLGARPLRIEDCAPEVVAIYTEAAKLNQMPPVYPGSIFIPCEVCGVTVALGPRLQTVHDDPNQPSVVLCLYDAALAAATEQRLSGVATPAFDMGNPYQRKTPTKGTA